MAFTSRKHEQKQRQHSAPLTPVDETLAYLIAEATVTDKTEVLDISASRGRVLATDLVAKINVPPADNSAMDGYAFHYEAICQQLTQEKKLIVSQRIAAGDSPEPLTGATLVRIFTGAIMPPGADTVVMQENTTTNGNMVTIDKLPKQGSNVRPAGQDLKLGAIFLKKGSRIRSQEIGLLASAGISKITVYAKLKVAVLSTGSELVFPGSPLYEGQIYNSNHYTLIANIEALDMIPVDLGLIKDTQADTLRALTEAAKKADCIITSGGVSVGDEDHVKAAVESLGQLDLWRVAIKPGKPFTSGSVAGVPFLGLPGNPAAAFVTFMVFARPYLLNCQGTSDTALNEIYGQAQFSVQAGQRREYRRVQYRTDESGRNLVFDSNNQSSGVLSSLCWANGLALIEPNQCVAEGDLVKVQLLP